MEKEFVPYELAVKLKALGFDEPCLACYTENAIGRGDKLQFFVKPIKCNDDYVFVSAPTFSQIFRWFREKYNLEGYPICVRIDSKRLKAYQYVIISNNYQSFQQLGDYSTYEEAELECLRKLIEIVKKIKNEYNS